MIRFVIAILFLSGIAAAEDSKRADAAKPCPKCVSGSSSYSKRIENYLLPDVTLTDHRHNTHQLTEFLDAEDKPILLTFSFTSCSTICPVLNATFAALQKKLEKAKHPVRLTTVSIDPACDTPEVLAEYAKSFKAADNWTFLTGSETDIQTVRKAFHAHTGNKGRHAPLIFIRANPRAKWLRLDGLMSRELLLAEFQAVVGESDGEAE